MDYFPGFMNLKGRQVLVVGGGDVALRKARLLHTAGASVLVVAPETNSSFKSYIETHGLMFRRREFETGDLEGCWLAVAATGVPDVDGCVFTAASDARVFCNSVDDPANSSYITPAIVDRSPVVVAISSGGAAPVLARSVREKIEMLLPARLGRLAELAARWRGRAKAGIVNTASRRRFWNSFFRGVIPALAIGQQSDQAEKAVARLLLDFGGDEPERGKAWLVGAGPGDPDLLTMRAVQILQSADVILHDRLVSGEILALARRDAEFESVGKMPGSKMNSQDRINARLVELVRAGKHVCRLKGGDPFIFARGGEEFQVLQDAGFSVEVVPGITAAAGCAAAAGIPLTHRDLSQSVAFVAAHGKNSVDALDWPSLARDRQTLVFYMAVARFSEVMNQLIANGRSADTPVAIVERGTLPGQRVVRGRLGQLQMLKESQRLKPPAILIVGKVAAIGTESRSETQPCPDNGLTQTASICAK